MVGGGVIAVAGTVVQENGPEPPEVKQQLWSAIEAGAPANALLASSSSSGIPTSVMSQAMRQPGRLVIGHLFNPPYLVPLVEVVPSPGTDPEVVEAAVAFYRAMGKQPQVLSREIPGFVANRLQAALFREAVHLVAQGVVTEQELDAVVTSSIGMRWAVAGPFQTFHHAEDRYQSVESSALHDSAPSGPTRGEWRSRNRFFGLAHAGSL